MVCDRKLAGKHKYDPFLEMRAFASQTNWDSYDTPLKILISSLKNFNYILTVFNSAEQYLNNIYVIQTQSLQAFFNTL